jgi:NADH:ubiquinone oxidoreductase subunit 3 (subunit A)
MSTLLMLFIVVPVLALLLLGLNILLATHRPDEAKNSSYECGFAPIQGQTRSTFQIQFYIIAMLFLIFDLEIICLFPISVTLYQISTYGFSIALIFFMVLTIGFILEIGSGAIKIHPSDDKIVQSPVSTFTNNNKNKLFTVKNQ